MASHHGEGDGTANMSTAIATTILSTIDHNEEQPRDTGSSSGSTEITSTSAMELNVPEERTDAVLASVPAATAEASTPASTPATASVSPPVLSAPAALPTPVEPTMSTSTPAATTSSAASPTGPAASADLPIRAPPGSRYRPPSPPLPPIPPEWLTPSSRYRRPSPPLPPNPSDWQPAMGNPSLPRVQGRHPSASNQAPIQPSAQASAQAGASAAGRTNTRRPSAAASSEQPLPPPPSQSQPQPQQRLSQQQQRQEFALPRWQPDAEVTYCPICLQQFSIFVRKHHCRKCGRVVCASCSPHRITIPYPYIVQPPGSQPYQMQAAGTRTGLTGDVNSLGGGERVRLCNPCVPDPNTAPPSSSAAAAASNRYHSRSFSSTNNNTNQGATTAGDTATIRTRRQERLTSADFSIPYSTSSLSPLMQTQPTGASTFNPLEYTSGARIQPFFSSAVTSSGAFAVPSAAAPVAVTPSSSGQSQYRRNRLSLPPVSAIMSSAQEQQLQLQLQLHQHQQQQLQQQSQSHHHQSHRAPRHQIAEEDECPVCRRELPKRSLADFETLREAHITECIVTHSRYMGGSPSTRTTPGGSSPSANGASGSSPIPSSSLPTGTSDASASSSTAAPPPPRLTGMFPYRATEKDCVDAAECTICLEDLEVGVPMARLECFCRFHERCIRAWFENHPGRCPVHQHDNFGY